MLPRTFVFFLSVCAVSISMGAGPASAGALETVFEDGFESADSCGWGVGPETCPGFAIVSPPVQVAPGQEATRCYYVHTGNAVDAGVAVVGDAPTGCAYRDFDARLGVDVEHARRRGVLSGCDQSLFQCEWDDAGKHVAAVGARVD
jgi:hypothetical protein